MKARAPTPTPEAFPVSLRRFSSKPMHAHELRACERCHKYFAVRGATLCHQCRAQDKRDKR